MGPSQRRAQAQHHQPRQHNQLPRIHEGGRRPQGSREDGEGRTPLDLQPSHERGRVQAAHRQPVNREPDEELSRGDKTRSEDTRIIGCFRNGKGTMI